MKQENFILALSSPSGAGKTSIARKILESDPKFVTSISVTTRPKRPSEIDGRDYFFVTKEKFKSMKEQDQLLEDAMVHGNYYGSPKQYVLEMLSQDHDVIFDIDWQGTHSLKEKLGSIVISIF
ncbi:MAG: guanylate kinase, partial [Pseudomonadota bacterium]